MLLFVSAVQQSPPIAQAIREGERGLRPVGALARSWLTNLVLLCVCPLLRAQHEDSTTNASVLRVTQVD